MAFKNILVHVDRSEFADARVETALALAADHQAHLVALYTIYRALIPAYAMVEIPAEILAQHDKEERDAAVRIEAKFRREAEMAGVSHEWRCLDGDALDLLELHARYCDVAVVGQRNPDTRYGLATAGVIPDDLVLSLGRPVIVVPFAGRYPKLGERIMVAWDAGAAATRAVNDALPLLQRAKKVSVLAVNPKGGTAHGAIPSADISAHLARHGVKAEAQSIEVHDIEIGDMILSRAADQGIDLIVMGAYGHARWRELILGGVTRHLLDHMTAPVLMSH